MNGLAVGAGLLAAVLVQTTAGPDLAVAGGEPNLVLTMVAARAWRQGLAGGPWLAVAGGLLLDIGGQGPLGVHALALLAAAALVSVLAARSDPASIVIGVLVTIPATIAYSLVVLAAAQLLRQPLPAPSVAVGLIMTGAAYQVVLSLPVLLLLRRRARAPAW